LRVVSKFQRYRHPKRGRKTAKNPDMSMDDDSMTTDKPMGFSSQVQSAEAGDKQKPSKPNRLDRATRAKLGQQLRAVYDEIVSQGVPNRFTELLNRLDNNEGTQNAH
jgi:hypothetical protein